MTDKRVRDPWVAGGLALLFVATIGLVMLYRAAPQSVEQVRTSAWLSARPSAFAPHLSRAKALAVNAASSASTGRDSSAAVAYASAAEEAALAFELAGDSVERAAATRIWADATLAQSRLYLRSGIGSGLRPDNNEFLEAALFLVSRVLEAPATARQLNEAERLRSAIEQELRMGPLEWLP